MQKMVFFFPWREVSGGPFYLARIANEVARKNLYDVYYTDYVSGLCESLLEEKSITVLKYRDEEHFEIFPNEPVIVVMAEYWAHVMPKVHPKTKIVFFNWHNECISVLQRDWCATDDYIERFIRLVEETNSVFFCDKTHWLAHERNGIQVAERYVPVIIPIRQKVAQSKLIREKERNIAVLGRLCQDKIYAVMDLIDNIIALRDRVKTNIYIIGDGDYGRLLFERKYPENIRLVRCGTMDIKDVVSLLAQKTDILFAMGTSVLEGATIHLPAVIIPNAMEPFECNRYPYLFESKGYALGWYPEQIDDLCIETHTIEEIFYDIYHEKKKSEIGDKCYDYYRKNHMQNIQHFIEAVEATTLTFERYEGFVKANKNWKNIRWHIRDYLRKRYGYTQKKFCFLGVPLYIRTKTNDIHSNIYLLGIPVLRINQIGTTTAIHFLPLVWAWRIIQKTIAVIIIFLKQERRRDNS